MQWWACCKWHKKVQWLVEFHLLETVIGPELDRQGPSVDQTSKTQCLISPQISCWRSWRPDLVQSDLYSWSPVRKVTGEERAHAQNKSSKLRRFFYVLKQQIWWCLEVFSKKPGYTCIHLNYEPTNLLLFFFFATLNSMQQLKMDPF